MAEPDQLEVVAKPPMEMVRVPATSVLELDIDQAAMYIAPLSITDGSEDREGQRMNPDGLITVSHAANPVVFFNHSHAIHPMVPPIGMATKPDLAYDVYRDGDRWMSGCLFSQRLPLADQVFHLICEGIIRGRSIGGTQYKLAPYSPELRPQVLHRGQIHTLYDQSVQIERLEMYEWSWTPLPQNREMIIPERDRLISLKSVILSGRVNGHAVDPVLKALVSLPAFDEPLSVPGFTLPPTPKETRPMKQPVVALTFKGMTAAGARKFLQSSEDFSDTDVTLMEDGQTLKSVQVQWDGEVTEEPTEVDGITALIAVPRKPAAVVKPAAKKSAAVAKCDMPDAAMMVTGQENLPPVAENPDAMMSMDDVPPEVEPVLIDDPAPVVKGKPSQRFIAMFVMELDELIANAQAALTDIENPAAIEAANAACEVLAETRASLAGVHDSMIVDGDGVDKLAAVDGEGEESDDDEPVADAEKAMRADLFLKRRVRLPRGLAHAANKAMGLLRSKDVDGAANALGGVLKGIIPADAPSQSPTADVDPVVLSLQKALQSQTTIDKARRILRG